MVPAAQLREPASTGWPGRSRNGRRCRFGPRQHLRLRPVQPLRPHRTAIAEIKADRTVAPDQERKAAPLSGVKLSHQALFPGQVPEPHPAFHAEAGQGAIGWEAAVDMDVRTGMDRLSHRSIHGQRSQHLVPIGAFGVRTEAADLKLIRHGTADEEPNGSPRGHAHAIRVGVHAHEGQRPVGRDFRRTGGDQLACAEGRTCRSAIAPATQAALAAFMNSRRSCICIKWEFRT